MSQLFSFQKLNSLNNFKITLLSVLLLLVSSQSFAKLKLEVRHSEAASFLHFMDAGFKEPFTSKTIIKLLERDGLGPFKNKQLKKELKAFKSYLHQGYDFPDKSPNRNRGFWGEDALIMLAVESKNLEDFERKLTVLLPYRGVKSYQKLKNKLYPFFLKKLWEPSLEKQEGEIQSLKKALEKTQFESLLTKAETFYKSDYPSFLPFKVGLVPIPDKGIKKKHTSAVNIKDTQVVPYMLTTGASNQLEVIFHEFCHPLYASQPNSVKKHINDFYINNKSPYALFVYRYINEILATSLGNGLYQKQSKGSLPKGNWYDVAYINKMAKAMFPMVERYIKKGKKIDRKFLKETLKQAKLIFPNAPYDVDTNFMAISIFVDSHVLSLDKIKSTIQGSFRVQSYMTKSSIGTEELKIIQNRDLRNTIVVSSTISDSKPKFVSESSFNKVRRELTGKSNFLVILPRNGHYTLWFNVESEQMFTKVLQKLKDVKKLPLSETVQHYDL